VSVQLATSALKVQQHGWVEEVTRGTVPDNAAFNDILTQSFEVTPNELNQEQRALGTPYLHKIVKSGERWRASINFIPFDSDILMYSINRTGAKNVDKSLTWGVLQLMDTGVGTLSPQYQFAKGSTCNSITINSSADGVTCSSEWFCTDVTTPAATHGITGTPTWAALTSAGWSHLQGGANPINWNSVAQRTRSYSITVDNAVYEDQFLGSSTPDQTNVTTHTATGTVEIIWTNTTLWADMRTFTPRLLKISMGPATFITLTDAVLESGPLPRDASSTETTTVSYSLKAPKCEITTS
jgi:hypothetical protein